METRNSNLVKIDAGLTIFFLSFESKIDTKSASDVKFSVNNSDAV